MVAIPLESLFKAPEPRIDPSALECCGVFTKPLAVNRRAQVHVSAQQQAYPGDSGEPICNVREAGWTEVRCRDTDFPCGSSRFGTGVSGMDIQQFVQGSGERIAIAIVDEGSVLHILVQLSTGRTFSTRSISNGVRHLTSNRLQTSGIFILLGKFARFSWVTTVFPLASAWAIRM